MFNKLGKLFPISQDPTNEEQKRASSLNFLLAKTIGDFFFDETDKMSEIIKKRSIRENQSSKNVLTTIHERVPPSKCAFYEKHPELTPEEFSWLKINTPFESLIKKIRAKLIVELQQVNIMLYIYIYILYIIYIHNPFIRKG